MEPYKPPPSFYRFTQGIWVHFSGPNNIERPKHRSYITAVDDVQAVVIDERTFIEVCIDLVYTDFAHTWHSSILTCES